ncbi:hypothetical protein Rumeso_04049 [Rubellimicrobium mesophilum DSM 19309]|uniref:Uncharacterized protein n=2 Tax=Rubellimicrobium TaxID=295418 RepID=A0A017HKP9_9RHOB|nr:hypothetical protein Rumeso_04049 [Rubellimicrobium mesophilum DSM 19309]
MIVWSPHTEEPGALARVLPDRDRFRALTDYMAAPVVRKEVSGRVVELVRDPAPEVLLGDQALLRMTLRQQTSERKYTALTLSFAPEDLEVSAFNSGEPRARQIVDLTLTLVLETAFAGIPPEPRPHVFATTHTHAGRVEVNLALPRGVRRPDGSCRAHNPHPPRRGSLLLWDAVTDVINHAFGLADPGDPARARLLVRPDYVLKREAEEVRAFEAGLIDALPAPDPRLAIAATIAQRVDEGTIRNRAEVLAALVELIRPEGCVLHRIGRESVTVGVPGAPARERLELRGPHFASSFTGPEALVCPYNLPALRAERARVLASAPERLCAAWAERARATRAHLGQGAWPEVEPPNVLLARIAAAGRSHRAGESIALGAMPPRLIPSRHHELAPAAGSGSPVSLRAVPGSSSPTTHLTNGVPSYADLEDDLSKHRVGAYASALDAAAARPHASGTSAPRPVGPGGAGGARAGSAARAAYHVARDATGEHQRHRLDLDRLVGRLARPGGAQRLLSRLFVRSQELARALAPRLARADVARLIPPALTTSLAICTRSLERLHDHLDAFARAGLPGSRDAALGSAGRDGPAAAAPVGEWAPEPPAGAAGRAVGGRGPADRGDAAAPRGPGAEPRAGGGGDGAGLGAGGHAGADRGGASAHRSPAGGAGAADRGAVAADGDHDGLARGGADVGGGVGGPEVAGRAAGLSRPPGTASRDDFVPSSRARPPAGSLAERLRLLRDAAQGVMPGSRVAVRPVRRPDGVSGPGSTLTLKLPGMPLMLWSEGVLRFAAGGVSGPAAERLLEQIAARLGSTAFHAGDVRRSQTLVVVADAPSRDRFIAWAASPPAASLSQVGWLVLHEAVHDSARAVAAVRKAVEVSAPVRVIVVLPETAGTEDKAKVPAWEHGLSELNLHLPVTILRPTADGYEEVRPDPLGQEPSDEALTVTSGNSPTVGPTTEPNSPDGSEAVDANSTNDGALDPGDDFEAGPSPWRS